MRAAVIGLVGAVLAVGSAGAAGCPITKATVTVTDPKMEYGGIVKVVRPDLVGESFRVVRYTSRRKSIPSIAPWPNKLLGYEGYELTGKGGDLLVKRDYVDGSPGITPLSWASGTASQYGEIRWGGGRPERVKVGQKLDYFLDGPSSALVVTVSACH